MGKLTNLNPTAPIADADLPASMARDAEYIAADQAHVNATNPHQQYLLKYFTGLEFGLAEYNVIDFHANANPIPSKDFLLPDSTPVDFDVRLIASLGSGQNGQGTLAVQAALLNLLCKFCISGGAQVARLLASPISVDLPAVAAGGLYELSVNLSGAQVGDMAIFTPTQMPSGLAMFKIMAAVTSPGVARLYFHNLSNTSLDLPTFAGRLLVLGFA